ncbi:methyltransferase domain-containing protein [Cohnella cellulosilytica]|uniref:Methyltransferase domain-containing protein n=2 Tax=Cohnella cellulosilytica TaxID=986710 RepID=A0ABW2FGU0_9BACL
MALYFATVLPGLEFVLEDEIRVKIADAQMQRTERGKVFFHSARPAEALMALRTADNLYRPIHRFRVGPHKMHLAGIEHEISQADLPWELIENFGMAGYKINASRTGDHTYSRFDAAEAAAKGMARRYPRLRYDASGSHEVEFRLDIRDDDAVFALRLTDASFRYRAEQRRFAHAALRPSVAHALVWLSNPEETDVFIDPCCGSGTLLSERRAYPHCRIYGGDLSAAAVEASLDNVGLHDRVRILQWDARDLPIDSGHVDKAAANLPFGRQISTGENLPRLYGDIFKEIKRVLKRQGTFICLTDADDALQSAAEKLQFSCSTMAVLSLKGLHPSLYRLKKQ